MTNSNQIKEVPCPNCKKPTLFTKDNPYRPFCSDRCKLIDLGAWASESYRVPLQNQSQNTTDFSEIPPEQSKIEDESD